MATTKQLLIQFSDEATPATWSHNCTINTTQEFVLELSTVDAVAPNCLDPNATGWTVRAGDAFSAGISGAGTMDPVSYGVLREKMLAGVSFPVRISLPGLSGAAGGGYYQGNFIMTSLGIAKEGKGFVTSTVELQSDGEITWTAAA